MSAEWNDLGECRADHRAQLVGGEEVDVEPGFGAGEVTDGEAAIVVVLKAVVVVVDVGVGRVNPDAKQASARDAGGGVDKVGVGLLSGAVLEDLDADDQLVARGRRQSTQITNDELIRPVRPTLTQLDDCFGGYVEPEQVKSAGEQRDEVGSSR
ncbi:MAG: hypothetical protein ACRDSH_18725 [Pseudonocardiaceae bacterium]